MFRRSKPQHNAPAAPTFEQILEDLDTFEIEKPELEPVRSLHTITSGKNELNQELPVDDEANSSALPSKLDASQQQMGPWLRTFETFRTDVSALHILRRQLQMGKTELQESRQGIHTELDDLRRRVTDALGKSVI